MKIIYDEAEARRKKQEIDNAYIEACKEEAARDRIVICCVMACLVFVVVVLLRGLWMVGMVWNPLWWGIIAGGVLVSLLLVRSFNNTLLTDEEFLRTKSEATYPACVYYLIQTEGKEVYDTKIKIDRAGDCAIWVRLKNPDNTLCKKYAGCVGSKEKLGLEPGEVVLDLMTGVRYVPVEGADLYTT